MSKTYFAVSDIHGFYDELVFALKEAGYDKKNSDHILIVVGDIFDRGPKNLFVYKFLKGIPKERRILIRGNHESMFVDLIKKPFPAYYDFQNKTVDAFCQLSGFKEDYLTVNLVHGIPNISKDYWAQIVEVVKMMKVDEWIKSNEWVEYFELDDLIFTHSFLPLRHGGYNPNWRVDAEPHEWDKSHWGNPLEQYQMGLFKEEEEKGKKLIFGHWDVYDIRIHLSNDAMVKRDNSIFEHKGFIAMDGSVYKQNGIIFHPTNVLVIKDGKYTKHHISNIPSETDWTKRIFTTDVE